ncbi:MAG: class I poly(R)-hydroxyalkanoic acid synthase, partial [Octadecabacter sp.]|nr:class I poly(R)-hydroxyalkanoic acid synthase [Octadecabacter sp.]
MTTYDSRNSESTGLDAALPKLEKNMERIQELTQRLLGTMSNKRKVPQDLQGPEPELYARAGSALFQEMVQNPSKIIEQQIGYWGKTLQHFVDAQQALSKGNLEAPEDNT